MRPMIGNMNTLLWFSGGLVWSYLFPLDESMPLRLLSVILVWILIVLLGRTIARYLLGTGNRVVRDRTLMMISHSMITWGLMLVAGYAVGTLIIFGFRRFFI